MWSSRIEIKPINMLRDVVQKHQTIDRSTLWTVRHWNHFATKLQNLYRFRYIPKQVRQKYQQLKADYQTFKRLQAQTGLGWDPIVGTVVAPDEFWDKEPWLVHPHKEPLALMKRMKCLTNFGLLELVGVMRPNLLLLTYLVMST
ncbi:unnamed protein product [Camellia sinensis]